MTHTKRSRSLRAMAAVAMVAVLGVTSAACSSSNNSPGGTGGSGKLIPIHITMSPVVDGEAVFYAIAKGYFEEQGLKVDAKQAPTNSGAIPTLLNGQIQFAAIGPGTAIPAIAQGIPVVVVAPLSLEGTTNENSQEHLIALKSANVNSAADLKGKTIAVPTLKNMGQIQVSSYLKSHGVDPNSVHYIAVPYPQQQAALQSKRVDIAFTTEPYLLQIGQAMDIVDLGATAPTVAPSIPDFFLVSIKSYTDANKDIVRKLQLAVQKATQYLSTHQAEARTFITTFTKLGAGDANNVILPVFSNDQAMQTSQLVADAAYEYGVISTKVTWADHVLPFPLPAS